MASPSQGGDERLAGLDQELRRLRGRLEKVRRGIAGDTQRAGAKRGSSGSGFGRDVGAAAAAPGREAEEAAELPGDDEVLTRLRGLLDELRTMTGESP
jgi:hypothetical protein